MSFETGKLRLLQRLAALLCAVAVAFAAVAAPIQGSPLGPAVAYAADLTHEGLEAPNDGMNGKTWEQVRDEREGGDPGEDGWDNVAIGGTTYPKFDLFNLDNFGNAFFYLIYSAIESAVAGLVDVCNELFDFIQNSDALTLEMDDSNYASVYSAVVTLSETVIQPIAVGFLGLALVLELLQFSRDVATNKGDHFSMAGSYVWIIVKFAAIMTLIGHTTLLTRGIYELFLSVARMVVTVIGGGTALPTDSFDSIMIGLQEITYANFGQVLILAIVAIVMVFAVAITVLRVVVLTVTRMFEIYVRAAFSGIPLVMLTNRSTRDGGLRYFKEFAGACLQAAVLIVMIAFAGVIMNVAALTLQVDAAGFVGIVLTILAPIAGVLGVNAVIGMSRDIANRILGA